MAGASRPAQAAEVLQVAQQQLLSQVRQLEILSSPQVARDFLRVRLAGAWLPFSDFWQGCSFAHLSIAPPSSEWQYLIGHA